jgi:type IV secretory pathway VirJ component
MEKLRGLRVVCFYGAEETDTLCRDMDPTLAECVLLPGAHHFGGQYGEIANRILSELKTAR